MTDILSFIEEQLPNDIHVQGFHMGIIDADYFVLEITLVVSDDPRSIRPFMFSYYDRWYIFECGHPYSMDFKQEVMDIQTFGSRIPMQIPTIRTGEVVLHLQGHKNKDDADAQLMRVLMEMSS